MAYVLIVVMLHLNGGGMTSVSHDFRSKETCEAARTQIVSSASFVTKVVTSGCYAQ